MKSILLILPVLFFPAAAVHAADRCLNETCFSETLTVGGEDLPLRGIGLLEFWKMDLYTAAFYVPEEAQGIDGVLQDVPKALIIHYHRGVPTKWMNKVAVKKLRENPDVDYAAVEDRVKLIGDTYVPVNDGDRYELRYAPGGGTTLLLNGQEQIRIPGADFAKAYFGIWVSHVPGKEKLRDELLNMEKT